MTLKSYSVKALVSYLKQKNDYDENLVNLSIKGELSNVKIYPSKHIYFDLKDDKAKISGIMFASSTNSLNFKPVDGDQVTIIGSIKVYQNNATFQVYAQEIIKDGYGELFITFENNKKQLEQEGYFEQSKKQNIPMFCKQVAIITGRDSAALKDMLVSINTRYKLVKVIVFPCLVQGKEAPQRIMDMIKLINNYSFDVIILARGGGSFEDLNAFNDVELAKTIFNSKIPIISGIGHESDTTIADYVSDYRAPTPTAAAIKIAPDSKELIKYFHNKANVISSMLNKKIHYKKDQLRQLENNPYLKDFRIMSMSKMQNIDYLYYQLQQIINNKIQLKLTNLNKLKLALEQNNIKYKQQAYAQKILSYHLKLENIINYNIKKNNYNLDNLATKIDPLYQNYLKEKKYYLNQLIIKLNLLDPNIILNKGYTLTYQNNKLIKDFNLLKIDDEINIIGANNQSIIAQVKGVKNNGN